MKNYINRLKNSYYKDALFIVIIISFLGTLSNQHIKETSDALLYGGILSVFFILIFLLSHIKK